MTRSRFIRCGSTGSSPAQLAPDAVVIGDGGDFVSYAGKYLEPQQPGGWLDPGPYGCLGTGLGYAIAARVARPDAQVVLLLGDGAAGFSLMDADTLVRHGLPVVMVCGNNGIWGLEKHPMQALYGYDVAADLQPGCRYDQVVTRPRRRRRAGQGCRGDRSGAAARLRRRRSLPGERRDRPGNAYPRSTSGRLSSGRLFDNGDQVALLDDVALGHGQPRERARVLGEHRDLHLHGLQNHQRVTIGDGVALGRHDLPDVRHHLRPDLATCISSLSAACAPS